MTPAIAVRNLNKIYKVYARPTDLVRELITGKPRHSEAHILRDLTFSIAPGEIVGLIGINGAGKSTLLKILAGLLDSTSGDIAIQGNLRAILELGTGFQEHYSGRENIYVGGACLGYTRSEIDASLDWIIDFAELRSAIDRPFRTYSSGMKSRLTFAVTFCRRPEILIVDEALSVGDLGFTNKCIGRILELCKAGSTALVVSHNMYLMERLCNRVLYLKEGRIAGDGDPKSVGQLFEADMLERFAENQREIARSQQSKEDEEIARAGERPSPAAIQRALDDPEHKCPAILHWRLVRLKRVAVLDRDGSERNQFHVGEPVTLEMTFDSDVAKDGVVIGVQIFHETGVHVASATNHNQLDDAGRPQSQRLHLRPGEQTVRIDFPRLFLGDGKYFLSVGVSPKNEHYSDLDLLFRQERVAVVGFYRSDCSWKSLYDPPTEWKLTYAAAEPLAA